MRHLLRFIIFTGSVLWVAIFSQSCLPVFQQYQGAETQAPGTFEITPNVATVSAYEDGESIHMQNQLGAQVAVGVAPQLDVRAAYTRVMPDFGGLNYFAFGPKISLVPARVAVFALLDFGFGELLDDTFDDTFDDASESTGDDDYTVSAGDTWSFNPTLLFTLPISERFEINPSTTVRIPLYEDGETLLAFNLGLGLGWSADGPWKLRPEFGVLVNPGESGAGLSFGVGLSFDGSK